MKNLDIMNNYYKVQRVLLNMKALPAKVTFALVRNTNALHSIVQDIEQVKYNIATTYGIQDKDNPDRFNISKENIEFANKELHELQETDTPVNLMYIRISDIESLDFTPAEMDAIMFMIKQD